MIRKLVIFVFIFFCVIQFPNNAKSEYASIPNVVTADIQEGIEKYIEAETFRGGGHFKLSSQGKEYLFKLVRVHTEYLANLSRRNHFACVDMVDTNGDVYDVDFFLSGDPGNMTVTKTILHKLNGIPFYTWKQNSKGEWEQIPIKEATAQLLGVIHKNDQFDFLYRIKLPVIKESARMWVPYPSTDSFQKIKLVQVSPSLNYQVLQDTDEGNKIFYFELGPKQSKTTIDIRYRVKRKEKRAYPPTKKNLNKILETTFFAKSSNDFKKTAEKILKGKKGDLVRARALYDHVLDHMRYMKYGTGWGEANAAYACSTGTGNCTDFHSYFIALAHAASIPARFAIGAAIPSERNNGGIDGYHCWAEFYAEKKWWPVDISEADKYSSLSTYYFGHHPANRFEFSRGRNLIVEPGPVSSPINFLAYPILEINGKPAKAKAEFFFNRNRAQNSKSKACLVRI